MGNILQRAMNHKPTKPEPTPIEDLGRVLSLLTQNQSHFDEPEAKEGGKPEDRVARWRDTNLRALESVREAIASIAATNLREATIQVMIAAGEARRLEQGQQDGSASATVTHLNRLLRSALAVLARADGLDLAQYGAAQLGPDAPDWPFPPARPSGDPSP
jgi:uncharacterized membrane protein YccC